MIALIAQQMMVFLIMLLVGAFAARRRLLTDAALDSMNVMSQRVFLPIMVFGLVYRDVTLDAALARWPMIPLAACLYAALLLLTFLLARILRLGGEQESAFRMAFTFGNTGFIGLPLLSAVYGSSGSVDLMMFMIVDQLVLWTLGVRIAAPQGRKPSLAESLKGLANPNMIAFALGIAAVASGIQLPAFLVTAVDSLGAVASPLCMVCIGCMSVRSRVGGVVLQREFYAGVVAKMLAVPIACAPLLAMLPLGGDVAPSLILMAAMPATTLVPLVAAREGGDGQCATRLTVGTIAVSVLSVPLVALVVGV